MLLQKVKTVLTRFVSQGSKRSAGSSLTKKYKHEPVRCVWDQEREG